MADLSPIHSGLGPVPCGECPLTARLSKLLSQFRVDSDRHFSESMVLSSLLGARPFVG